MNASLRNFVDATLKNNESNATAYKALELWQQFFEYDNDPFVVQTYWDEDLLCYFCDGKPGHKPDCIYIRAKKLIKGD